MRNLTKKHHLMLLSNFTHTLQNLSTCICRKGRSHVAKTTLALSALTMLAPANASAQGWPANFKGVMLQGFYWNSYSDTNWSVLEKQADELSEYFKLIWIPQSGYCGGNQ